jgi:hypothetical protein
MIEIECKTNLDCCKNDEWPQVLPCRPLVGDRVISGTGVQLEITAISFVTGSRKLQLDLWIPKNLNMHIEAFQRYIARTR